MSNRTFLMENFDKLICYLTPRQVLGWKLASHRVALLVAGIQSSHLNGLHAGLSPRSKCRDKVGYTIRFGEPFCLLHEQARHGDAAAGPEVPWCLIAGPEPNQASRSYDILTAARVFALIVDELAELSF